MNGTKAENNKSGVVDGSRFVFEGPADPQTPHHRANEANQPMMSTQPSPDAFMPRPTRPFPISSRDENPKRGNWWNKIEFIFACIAVCVNGTAFLSLPYKVFRYGGGIFFILFSLGMIFIMFPYVILEMALGQFSSSGFISVWNLSPLFKGFGVVATLYLALNNVIITIYSTYHLLYAFITVKYMVYSDTLPWLGCSNPWNTGNCYDITGHVDVSVNGSASGGSMWQSNMPSAQFGTSPASEYFNELVGYSEYSDLTKIGTLKPTLVFALLATWGFILALTCLGAKLTGKVAYFLMPISVILLFALLIRGATLPGAVNGLIYFLSFDMNALLSWSPWMDAFGSVLHMGVLGLGVFSSLSSYNKFHNNFCLDALFIMIAVIFINLMIVLVVATYIGFFASTSGTTVDNFVIAGLSLTLETMPTILGAIPSTNAWTCVFFLTIFLLITSSSIYMVQALLTTLLDLFHLPHSFIFLLPASGIICVLSFLVSLPMVTEAGLGVVEALDMYTVFWAAPVITIVLPLVSVWVYGTIPKWDVMRLPREIQKMVGFFPKPIQFIFLLFWTAVIPICSAVYLLYHLVNISFFLTIWMEYVFLALGLLPLLLIPIFVGIYQLFKLRQGYTYFTRLFWRAAKSSPDWGPPVEHHRQQVGYSRAADSNNPHQLNSEIHFNPATAPLIMAQDTTAAAYPQARQYSPPPPAYNEHQQPGQTSPGSAKNLSPAPSSAGSGLPTVYPSPLYPSPLVEAGPPASPATLSATDTVDSNRLYPSATLDYTTGAETDLALSEQEDSLFVNVSSHETTL